MRRLPRVLVVPLFALSIVGCGEHSGDAGGHAAPADVVASKSADPAAEGSRGDASLVTALQTALAEKSQCEAALRAAQKPQDGPAPERCNTEALEEELKEAKRRVAALHLDSLSQDQDRKRQLNEAESARRADAAAAQRVLDEQGARAERELAVQQNECRNALGAAEDRISTAEANLAAERSRCAEDMANARQEIAQLHDQIQLGQIQQLQLTQQIQQLQALLAGRGGR